MVFLSRVRLWRSNAQTAAHQVVKLSTRFLLATPHWPICLPAPHAPARLSYGIASTMTGFALAFLPGVFGAIPLLPKLTLSETLMPLRLPWMPLNAFGCLWMPLHDANLLNDFSDALVIFRVQVWSHLSERRRVDAPPTQKSL